MDENAPAPQPIEIPQSQSEVDALRPSDLGSFSGLENPSDNHKKVQEMAYHAAKSILEKQDLKDRLERDPLTGLYNKQAWVQKVTQRLAEAKQGDVLVVFEIDLSNFKNVNDNYGHEVGDGVLKEFAILLKDKIRHNERENDMVTQARLGGDEFAVFMDMSKGRNNSSSEPQKTESFRKRMSSVFAEYISQHPELAAVNYSFAVGSAIWHEGMSAEDLLKKADESMYGDKRKQQATDPNYTPR